MGVVVIVAALSGIRLVVAVAKVVVEPLLRLQALGQLLLFPIKGMVSTIRVTPPALCYAPKLAIMFDLGVNKIYSGSTSKFELS